MEARENKCQISQTRIVKHTGKILKISCAKCHFVKFDIYFLGLSREILIGVVTNN